MDKTTSVDKTTGNDELAAQVERLQYKTNMLVEIVQELLHRASYNQFMMTNASPPAAGV